MVELVVSALMWTLVGVLVVFRRARKERSVLYAAVTIAVTMMLNDDDLYFVVDGWFGARDVVHLISAITLMFGVHYLAKGISRAGAQPSLGGWPARAALTAAILVTTVAFVLVPHEGGTTASFMRVYGDHPAAAVYSSTQYVYFIYVFTALARASAATLRSAVLRRERVAAVLLITGSLCVLLLSLNVLVMNVAQLAGGLSAAEPWRPTYYLFQVLTFAFLAGGLAVAPIGRWVTEVRRSREIRSFVDRLAPLWSEAVSARPAPGVEPARADPELRLHRRIIEIRDAAMDGRNDFALDDDQRELLRTAEERLLAGA
ncbi:DUF6545 domain-containing protein [Microbacterium sp. LMI1-1-1.1]|uniref:DUF6545 domain-containing protein n=1 Tax=Microbacterium sp. LMI1-1-1.1 TaxID=3135223 RepID=UPI00346509E0